MLRKIKDKISRVAQRALGIEGLRFNLDVIRSKLDVTGYRLDRLDVIGHRLDKLDVIGSKLDVITERVAKLDAKLQNLTERGDSDTH